MAKIAAYYDDDYILGRRERFQATRLPAATSRSPHFAAYAKRLFTRSRQQCFSPRRAGYAAAPACLLTIDDAGRRAR